MALCTHYEVGSEVSTLLISTSRSAPYGNLDPIISRIESPRGPICSAHAEKSSARRLPYRPLVDRGRYVARSSVHLFGLVTTDFAGVRRTVQPGRCRRPRATAGHSAADVSPSRHLRVRAGGRLRRRHRSARCRGLAERGVPDRLRTAGATGRMDRSAHSGHYRSPGPPGTALPRVSPVRKLRRTGTAFFVAASVFFLVYGLAAWPLITGPSSACSARGEWASYPPQTLDYSLFPPQATCAYRSGATSELNPGWVEVLTTVLAVPVLITGIGLALAWRRWRAEPHDTRSAGPRRG